MVTSNEPLPSSAPYDEPFLINLLYKSYKVLEREILASMVEKGYSGLGISESRVLLSIGANSASLNNLAVLLQASRQYVSRAVHSLEKRNYVTLSADPNDARSTIVTLAPYGEKYCGDIFSVKRQVDATIEKILGPGSTNRISQSLISLNKEFNHRISSQEISQEQISEPE